MLAKVASACRPPVVPRRFDLSDAALAIAIALLAVAALTKAWWLYWLSWLPVGLGVLMGLSGLLGWSLHPDTLTRLLA